MLQSYTLNELGRRFPGYLRETRPQGGDGAEWADFLIDLAELEWSIYEVFDGPGLEKEEAMTLPAFAFIPQEDWLSPFSCGTRAADQFVRAVALFDNP